MLVINDPSECDNLNTRRHISAQEKTRFYRVVVLTFDEDKSADIVI